MYDIVSYFNHRKLGRSRYVPSFGLSKGELMSDSILTYLGLYQATYGVVCPTFYVLLLQQKLVIHMTVRTTVSHIKTQ